MKEYNQEDIRLMFIREFAGGEEFNLGHSLTNADFKERIRIAIWRNKKSDVLFQDTGKTYADMFTKLFGCSIEKRTRIRPEWMTDPAAREFHLDESQDDN